MPEAEDALFRRARGCFGEMPKAGDALFRREAGLLRRVEPREVLLFMERRIPKFLDGCNYGAEKISLSYPCVVIAASAVACRHDGLGEGILPHGCAGAVLRLRGGVWVVTDKVT